MKCINFQTNKKTIVGMVHIAALPGTPANVLPVCEIVKKAAAEAKILADGGVDAILIENMHDVPYLKNTVGPEIVAAMTAVACHLREQCTLPIGIQILAAANKEALAVAQAAKLNFIRAEGFVFAHLADEGLIESCAGELLRYRKMIDAGDIQIFTDIRKKHSSHAITADISLEEQVKTAVYFGSDGIVITGRSTGEEALIEDVQIARHACSLPVLIGSGITATNIKDYWSFADVFIIGSFLKENGNWRNPVSKERLSQLMNEIACLRNNDCF